MGILAKLAFEEGIDPLTLIALRLIVSSTTLAVSLSLFNRKAFRIQKTDAFMFLALGAFAIAFQRVSYFYSVNLTTPTVAAILFYTYPVFVTIFGVFFLNKRPSTATLLAVVLTLLGTSLVVQAYDVESLRASLLGILFGLSSSLLFVAYVLMTKKLRRTYSHYTLTFYGDAVGAVLLLPTLLLSAPNVAGFSANLWILIFSIAWAPSLLAYLLYSYALNYCDVTKGSILGVVEPLSAALFSAFLLMENLELLQVFGVAVALIGVALIFREKSHAPA